jgi:hypothetical protein
MSFFGTGVQSRRLLRVWDARWQLDEMGGRTAFVVPRRAAGVSVVQAIVEGHDGRAGGFVKDLLVGRWG